MKHKIFYTVLLITASNFIMGYAGYGSDGKRASLPKSDQKIIEEALTKDEGAGKRIQKRAEARDLQKKGEQFKKDVKSVTGPLSRVGTTVGIVASASGDPHAKMGAAAFKLSISAIDGLGKGIAQIVIGIGRYQERSHRILSNIEVLLEDLQKSIDKKQSLEKKLQALSTVEKTPEPVQRIGYDLLLMSELPKNGKPAKGKIYLEKVRKNDSTLKDSELKYILMQPDGTVGEGTLKIQTTKDLTPEILSTFSPEILEIITKEGYTASKSESRLKQLGKSTLNAAKTAEIKARQATDVLTNEKAKREEKIKDIQAELKVENENYNETIRLLQIILMQDTLNEIYKKIDIEGTIATLESDVKFYKEARDNLSKSKSKRKKQVTDIEKKEAAANKDLIYYLKFQKSPTETPQQLEQSSSDLVNKIKELTQLTKRGDTLYLQQREVQLDSEVNRAAIVALYREIDALKSQLAVLSKTPPTKGVTDPEPLKKEAISQRRPLPPKPPTQDTGPWSEDTIRKQREALRPSQGVAQRQPSSKGG